MNGENFSLYSPVLYFFAHTKIQCPHSNSQTPGIYPSSSVDICQFFLHFFPPLFLQFFCLENGIQECCSRLTSSCTAIKASLSFRFLFKKVFMPSLSSARIYIAPFLSSLFYWHLSYFLFLQLFLHELLTLPEIYVQKTIFQLLSSKSLNLLSVYAQNDNFQHLLYRVFVSGCRLGTEDWFPTFVLQGFLSLSAV